MLDIKTPYKILIVLFAMCVGIGGSFLLTNYVVENESSQILIQDFGYLGVLAISFIAGLNFIIPIPAATFVPVFTAGGMSLPIIIALLTLGTLAASLLAYTIGHFSRNLALTHYPKLQAKLLSSYQKHKKLLPYFIFFAASLIPLPDEIYLVPLGVIGVPVRTFLFPLILGTVIYQSLSAFGISNIFTYFLV
jgi:membrane protein DedA with SNARE-associated domain